MHGGWGLSDESKGGRGRVEGRELLGGRGEGGGKLCGWGWGLLVCGARDGGGEEEEEEEGVVCHCLVYLPVSFRRAIFLCCYFFSPALLSLFFFFFLSLDSPVVR